MTHKISFRVYYEDTDAGGVVYYANYLKFAERARTELLRSLDVNQSSLASEEGIFFVVRHAELDLKKPAKLDDLLEIETSIEQISGASITMLQKISNAKELLSQVTVKIVSVNKNFKPCKIPYFIKERMV